MMASRPMIGGVVRALRGGVLTEVGSAPSIGLIVVRRNGLIDLSVTGIVTSRWPPHPWHRSFSAFVGDNFWVRITKVSGDTPNAGFGHGVWRRLNGDVSVGYDAVLGPGSGTFTVEIAMSSGGTPIVAASAVGGYSISVFADHI